MTTATGQLTPVEDLRNDVIDQKPVDFNFGEGYFDTWESREADRCEECGHVEIMFGEDRCPNCEDGWLHTEGPMMNYWWPLPDRLPMDENEIAKALTGLPLCLVIGFNGQTPSEYGLALTGGGMDLSWYIAEAYMRIGLLPPSHIRLPKMAGTPNSERNRWIVQGVKRSAEIVVNWASNDVDDATDMEQWLAEEGR